LFVWSKYSTNEQIFFSCAADGTYDKRKVYDGLKEHALDAVMRSHRARTRASGSTVIRKQNFLNDARICVKFAGTCGAKRGMGFLGYEPGIKRLVKHTQRQFCPSTKFWLMESEFKLINISLAKNCKFGETCVDKYPLIVSIV